MTTTHSVHVQYSPTVGRTTLPSFNATDPDGAMKAKSRRTRVSGWLRRHHLLREKKGRKAEREKKKGCTELYTSTNKHSRMRNTPCSPSGPDRLHSGAFGHDIELCGSPMSFHSCYSYDREGYSWWWYTTASEVLRSYATSIHSKLETYLHFNSTKAMMTTSQGSLQFTPRLDMTFKTCLGSDFLNSQCASESFWETGFGYVSSLIMPVVMDISKLNPILPDARGSLFNPPIHPCARIGWGDVEETKFDFISLNPPINSEDLRTEIMRLAQSMRGHWLSLMPRCSDIEAQFKFMGLAYMKRSILARVAIPLTVFLEDRQPDGSFTNLHTWIHTPLGLRHINWSMVGDLSVDNDQDCGEWEGVVRVISLYLPSVDRTVRALQRIMRRPGNMKQGVTIETRCVLPDYQEGRILLLQIDTYPNACRGDFIEGALHVSRVLRYEHPVDNVLQMTSKTALTESGSLKDCTRIETVTIM